MDTVALRRGVHQRTMTLLKSAKQDEAHYSAYTLDNKTVTGRS